MFFQRAASAPPGRKAARLARFEPLEDRRLMSVSPLEQHFIYLLNRARHDPAAYQIEAGLPVDLSSVAPRAPLAVNDRLFESAEFHAREMADYNYFDHQSHVTGDWPNKMARDQGYALPASWPNANNYIESLAAGTLFATAEAPLETLIVDAGVPSLGHRNHLLGIDAFNADNREIGVGHAFGSISAYGNYWAIHATRSSSSDSFLTGVVFNDLNANGRYDVNEGLGGVTVAAGGLSTTTNAAGGWSIRAGAGTYTVLASGGSFAGAATAVATVAGNIEVDFISGQTRGIVNFEVLLPGAPTAYGDLYVLSQQATSAVSVAQGVLANDTDAENDPLTAVLVSPPARGRVTLAADGSFTYTAGAGFVGVDRFRYRARDGQAGGNEAMVTVVSYDVSHVHKLYQQVLARAPDDAGLDYWAGRIAAGDGYGRIAEGIFESDERLNPIIRGYYRDYLLREADDAGLAWWRDRVWKRDGGPENVVAGMIASDEFFRSAGGHNRGWVTELYRRLLDREPETSGLEYWTSQLNAARQTRPQIVLGFLRSDENFRLLVDGWFRQYLARSARSEELAHFAGLLGAGATHRQIQILLVDSAEYRITPRPPPLGTAQRL